MIEHLGDVFPLLGATQAFVLMLLFLLVPVQEPPRRGERAVRFGLASLLASWTYGALHLLGDPAVLRPFVGLCGVTVLSWGVAVMLLNSRRTS